MDGLREQYELLAEGIILQAVNDYRSAVRTLNKQPKTGMKEKYYYRFKKNQEDAVIRISEVESFFRSAWFTALTDCDGRKILKYIKENTKINKSKQKCSCSPKKGVL